MPNVNLEAALSFLSRWPQAHLFPAYWNTETGNHNTAVKWGSDASNDPEQIKRWAVQYPGWYFCVDLRPDGNTGLSVVDVDNKKGKNGSATLLDHALAGRELPPTLEASTPSNGTHLFFAGPVKTSVGKRAGYKLGEGLDTPGMVPVPGSIATGKGVYKIVHDRPIAAQQEWVRQLAGPVVPKDPEWETPLCELDQPGDVERAIRFLEDRAPESIEGDGGDHTLFKIAAKLKNLGISREKMVELLLDHWNSEKAYPPWTLEEIETKAGNAYKYSSKSAGCESLSAIFPPEPPPPPPPPVLSLTVEGEPVFGRNAQVCHVKPDEWVLGRTYLRGDLTLTVATGGVGKSVLTINEALAVASGKQLTWDKVERPGNVWLHSTEDSYNTIEKRVLAAKIHHGVGDEGVIWSSGDRLKMTFAVPDANGNNSVCKDTVEFTKRTILENNITLFVLDPLLETHELKENGNESMNFVCKILRGIARETKCAISVVHHIAKGGKPEYGNLSKARGASSTGDAVRSARTVYPMDRKEAGGYGMTPNQSVRYIRIDAAKCNYALLDATTRWYEKVSVQVIPGCDETSPALRRADLRVVAAVDPDELIRDMAVDALTPGEARSIYDIAVAIEKNGLTKLKRKSLSDRLEKLFAEPVYAGEVVLRPTQLPGRKGRDVLAIICEELPRVEVS